MHDVGISRENVGQFFPVLPRFIVLCQSDVISSKEPEKIPLPSHTGKQAEPHSVFIFTFTAIPLDFSTPSIHITNF